MRGLVDSEHVNGISGTLGFEFLVYFYLCRPREYVCENKRIITILAYLYWSRSDFRTPRCVR